VTVATWGWSDPAPVVTAMKERLMSDCVFSRKATFENGKYVKVTVFEPNEDEYSIIVGLRAGDGYQYENIGLDRDQAIKLRDLLNAAIVVDEACFQRRPQVIIEGPANDNDVEFEPDPSFCTDPDCQVCEISDEERVRRREMKERR
jgi:hypothetical protein